MKKIMILLIMMFSTFTFAQSESLNEKVSKAACALIIYTGVETEKEYRTALNPNSADELSKAERIIKKIKAYLDISDSYVINTAVEKQADDKNFVDVKVGFKSGSQTLEIDFEFIELNNSLLLISID